jgi:hypothetical protein
MGDERSASRLGRALAPGKGPPVPTVQEAGWAPEPVWTQRLEEISFRLCRGLNLNRPVVQPVARHYTDWATRLTKYTYIALLMNKTLPFNAYSHTFRIITISSNVYLQSLVHVGCCLFRHSQTPTSLRLYTNYMSSFKVGISLWSCLWYSL